VIPKRSHEQTLEELETLDGLELAELRELVKDGTSESTSESSSDESSSMLAYPKRWVSSSTVTLLYPLTMWAVWTGLYGFGDLIWDGEHGRPTGTSRETRRELRELRSLVLEDLALEAGTSRMLSLRWVVGSRTDWWAGSCVQWYPSMM
jgi:hypothetical protein